ncbi:MAG TPA: MBL fold metallo-hydrolase [Candidatus Angelobacter sp.]|nr:MBL fold metallo-hydrolase [Candidatus Angelobacter sp.]
MKNEPSYRLAASTAVEPLVNRWFAWSNVISPIPASLHLTHYQLPLLESYLNAPAIHADARKNPELIGGPFIDIPPEKSDAIRALLSDTKERLSPSIQWANEILQFFNRLSGEAHGQSLEPYYTRMPASLRGKVELVYDYLNRPSVRFFEAQLYESEFYRANVQSFTLYRVASDSARPFFLNTPRIVENDRVDWPVLFNDARVDELFKLSIQSKPFGFIRDLLGVETDIGDAQLKSLVTEDPLAVRERWNSTQVRYRYFGHACVLLEYKGTSILVDPFISLAPSGGGPERFTYDDLPEKIDYVLVTHNHLDHFNPEVLLRLRPRTGAFVVPRAFGALYGDVSLKVLLQKIGFRSVIEMDSFDTIGITGGAIIAVPFLGEHSDLLHGKTAYVVRTGSRQTMFAADSDCLDREIYVNIRKSLGAIDTLFLGMESVGAPASYGYGSLFPQKLKREFDESRKQRGCNATRGWDLATAIEAKRIYNYAMGLEPWTQYLLGLSMHEGSPQLQESEKLLRRIQQSGNTIAKRLYCKDEIVVDDKPDDCSPIISVPAGSIPQIRRADRQAYRA